MQSRLTKTVGRSVSGTKNSLIFILLLLLMIYKHEFLTQIMISKNNLQKGQSIVKLTDPVIGYLGS